MYHHFSLIRNNCDVTKCVISTKTTVLSFCQLLHYTDKFNKKKFVLMNAKLKLKINIMYV